MSTSFDPTRYLLPAVTLTYGMDGRVATASQASLIVPRTAAFSTLTFDFLSGPGLPPGAAQIRGGEGLLVDLDGADQTGRSLLSLGEDEPLTSVQAMTYEGPSGEEVTVLEVRVTGTDEVVLIPLSPVSFRLPTTLEGMQNLLDSVVDRRPADAGTGFGPGDAIDMLSVRRAMGEFSDLGDFDTFKASSAGRSVVKGTEGDDILVARGPGDVPTQLQGNRGDDFLDASLDSTAILDGGFGNDTMIGGEVAIVRDAGDVVIGTRDVRSFVDHIMGEGQEDAQLLGRTAQLLVGNEADNLLIGNSAFSQTIRGNGGDDTVVMGGSTGTYFGGEGADTFVVKTPKYGRYIGDFETGRDRILVDEERLFSPLLDDYDADRGGFTRDPLAESLFSGDGAVLLLYSSFRDDTSVYLERNYYDSNSEVQRTSLTIVTRVSGQIDLSDIYVGSFQDDPDTWVNMGADTLPIELPTGPDDLGSFDARDTSSDTRPIVNGTNGDDYLTAHGDTGAEATQLRGGLGNDYLDGSLDPRSILDGGKGADTMIGGDLALVDDVGDVVMDVRAVRVELDRSSSYTLPEGVIEGEMRNGGTLTGNDEDNLLIDGLKSGGNVALNGGAGDDTLIATTDDQFFKFGYTNLSGGEGADVFVFARLPEAMRITDFETGVDRVLFDWASYQDWLLEFYDADQGVFTREPVSTASQDEIFNPDTFDLEFPDGGRFWLTEGRNGPELYALDPDDDSYLDGPLDILGDFATSDIFIGSIDDDPSNWISLDSVL